MLFRFSTTSSLDQPRASTSLELSQSERDLVELVCSNFEDVVVICNSSNTMDLSLVDDYSQIKSVIWCPAAGQNGFNSLGRILSGAVNPSGKSAGTFIKNFEQAPWWNNFGFNIYDNMDEFAAPEDDAFVPGTLPHFVNYVEGIYVGYKFYETAAAESLINYDQTVVFPFGYGLSYTTFTQEMGPISERDGSITFDVTVTNTGSVVGKDVVQVYYNPPYTDGGIEKSAVNLVAFDKTGLLEPGASEVLTISFQLVDMASYDYSGNGAYILESGGYIISINCSANTVIDAQT